MILNKVVIDLGIGKLRSVKRTLQPCLTPNTRDEPAKKQSKRRKGTKASRTAMPLTAFALPAQG